MSKERSFSRKRSASFSKMFAMIVVASLFTSCIIILNDAKGSDAASNGSCGPNLTYQLDDYGKLTISGTGNMTDYNWGESPFWDNADIRTVIIEEGATSIGGYAFYYCEYLSSVTIPSSVTSIGRAAFSGCIHLSTINIPNGVTTIGESAFSECLLLPSITIPSSVSSIGYYAFDGCRNLTSFDVSSENANYSSENGVLFNKNKTTLIYYPAASSATTYSIPNGVNSIGELAFAYNTTLTSITIPDGVTSIGRAAFAECTSLTSIAIPDGVTSIQDYSFNGCTSLASVTIPGSVASIGEEAFYGCTSLTSIAIPDGVTSIGYGAFSDCSGLSTVTISSSVISINDEAFYGCTSLTSIDVAGGNANYSSVDGILFNKDKTILILHPAKKNTTDYSIPDGVETVMWGAFDGCTSLTSITIPSSVSDFDCHLLVGCTSLTSINVDGGNAYYSSIDGVLFDSSEENLIKYPAGKSGSSYSIPAGTLQIRDSAFRGCTSLTSVTIPNGVAQIGTYAFSGCTSLTSIEIPDTVTVIYEYAFSGCTSLTSIAIPDSVTALGDGVFSGCTSLTSIEIPNGVGHIANCEFENCTSLASVTIPGSVEYIGNDAFKNCTSLTSITIPGSVETIRYMAFYGCTSLASVTIQNGVESIDDSAFYGCTSLTSITIPSSVVDVAPYAFNGCTNLTSIEVEAGNANYSSEGGVLFNSDKSILLHYPSGKNEQSYTMPDSVTSLGRYAFANAESLMNINVSDNSANFKSIDGILTNKSGTKMYVCPSGRSSVTVPDSVIFISTGAISGSRTTELVIPSGITTNLGPESVISTSPSFTIVIEEGANVTTGSGIVFFSSEENALLTVIAPKGTVLNNPAISYDEDIYLKVAPVQFIETSQNSCEVESDTDSVKVDSSTISYLKTKAESNSSLTLDVSLEGGVKIAFDSEAIKTLNSTDATLAFKNVPVESLDEKTKEIVGDNPVFDISFGDNKDFGNGKVTITVPYTLPEGKNADELKILYIADGEVKEKISCQYADGYITFETNHLSMYSVGFEKPSSGTSPWVFVLIGVGVVAAAAAVAFFLIKKHN